MVGHLWSLFGIANQLRGEKQSKKQQGSSSVLAKGDQREVRALRPQGRVD